LGVNDGNTNLFQPSNIITMAMKSKFIQWASTFFALTHIKAPFQWILQHLMAARPCKTAEMNRRLEGKWC
jgi:hypothetical protein